MASPASILSACCDSVQNHRAGLGNKMDDRRRYETVKSRLRAMGEGTGYRSTIRWTSLITIQCVRWKVRSTRWRWPSRTNSRKLVMCIDGKNTIGSVRARIDRDLTSTVEAAWIKVQGILDEKRWSPRHKVLRIANFFFQAESEEIAEMGSILQEAELYFADQPEYRAMDTLVLNRFTRFVREALPRKTPRSRVKFGTQVLITLLESVGRSVARRKLPRDASLLFGQRLAQTWLPTSSAWIEGATTETGASA